MPFHETGDVRITPGGGLLSLRPNAVLNAMDACEDDVRCITLEQRKANGGESTGPIPARHPWGVFAGDQRCQPVEHRPRAFLRSHQPGPSAR